MGPTRLDGEEREDNGMGFVIEGAGWITKGIIPVSLTVVD